MVNQHKKKAGFLFLFMLQFALLSCTDEKPDSSSELQFSVSLTAANVIAGGQQDANGSSNLILTTENLLSGQVVFTAGLGINRVSLYSGFAGDEGAVIVELQQRSTDLWQLPPNLFITEGEREQLLAGGTYLQASSPSHPGGVVRGQILRDGLAVLSFQLSEIQVVPRSNSAAQGKGSLTLDSETSRIQLHLNTSDVSGLSAAVHSAYAGENGSQLTSLTQDNQNPEHWLLPDFLLSDEDLLNLLAAKLYVVITSASFPAGELRGQLLPPDFSVDFTELTGAEAVDGGVVGVTTTASAVAAATLDLAALTVSVRINTQMLPVVESAAVNVGQAAVNGQVLFSLTQNPNDISQWAIDDYSLSSENFNTISDHLSYFVVNTPLYPEGEVRGQWLFIAGDDTQPPNDPGVTLTQIQQNIFTPNCTFSGCHSGAAPAAGQNLSVGQTFANIVNVPSVEVPALRRVDAGNADNSYLVQKIEGTAAVGQRMPIGGAPLSTEEIQMIRDWINGGALDN